jgi:hypothetical protein
VWKGTLYLSRSRVAALKASVDDIWTLIPSAHGLAFVKWTLSLAIFAEIWVHFPASLMMIGGIFVFFG